jgi:phenylacetate-coenzyme A ligase PaaK-like adenylate-forming protein
MAREEFTPFAPMRARMQLEMMRRVPEHLARLGWSAERIAAHQRDGLRALLAHAREHSPFHARRLRAVDPARIELADLASLPVMTKVELMDAFDDVVTDRRITRALAESALTATKAQPQPLFDEFVCLASGGSSGVRGVFVLSFSAVAEFLLSVNRTPMKRSLSAGGMPPGGITLATVAAGSAMHATGSSSAWASQDGPVRNFAVPVSLPLAEIVARLNELQPLVLVGYPSVLARLARERAEGRLRIAPKIVSCTSENLLPEWRAAISGAFGAPITNAFGSTEGLVGMTEPDDDAFVFNSDVCIVELVDSHGAPVPPGVPSARILVTNLANHAQPLIRYEIDDSFIQQPPAADHGHLRAIVSGRASDVLRFGATDVHPLVIGSVLMKERAVSDYQVRQTSRGIDVTVLADGAFEPGSLSRELASALGSAGVIDAAVTVRAVAALERNAGTGKLQRFIRL